MKKPNFLSVGITALFIGAFFSPYVFAQETEDVPDSELTLIIEPDTLNMTVYETAKIDFKFVDKEGNEHDRMLSFFSGLLGTETGATPTEKISVDSEGNVTAKEAGSYYIMAWPSNSRVSGTTIKVEVAPLPVQEIVFENSSQNFYSNTSTELKTTIYDTKKGTRHVPLTYSSSNPEIAQVTKNGLLIAKKKGTTEITFTAEGVSISEKVTVMENPVTTIELFADKTEVRTGEVVTLKAITKNKKGDKVMGVPVTFSFFGEPNDMSGSSGSGLIEKNGKFVANKAGFFTIVAKAGSISSETYIEAIPRNVQKNIQVVGHKPTKENTSDFWIWEGVDGRDYAVTGTHSANGNAYFWDVTNPAEMKIIDTLTVDARTVNDVKVSEDGRIAVISREGASNRRNGIYILDVTDPYNVKVLSTFDDGLTGGVHNVFIYEDHVYAVNNTQKYDVINIEDPANPYRVSRFELERPGHVVHDVWIEDGIAYSSNFGDGLAVVDVGSKVGEMGTAGGSPENPVQLASHNFDKGWNHAAFPFKSKSTGDFYVAAGDEAFPGGEPAGWIHFVKFDGWENSREVARYEVPEAGSHNLWIKDDVMYVAFYDGGLRVVDISGELMGNLYDQGREIARFQPKDPQGSIPNITMTWGAQPYKDYIYIADMGSGLWALKLSDVKQADN